MALPGSQLAALSDVTALLDVLQGDDRPTFILEKVVVSTPVIVFRNSSLDRFIHHATDTSIFEDWATIAWRDSLSDKRSFCGREWSSRPFRETWMIVSGHPSFSAQRSATMTNLEDPISPISQNTSSTSTQTMFGPFRLPTPTTPPTPLSPFSTPNSQRRLSDWTLVDATTPWLHFVKHFPWSNTPFGAIHTWSLELRRSTAKIMHCPDPRILISGDERAIIYNEAFAGIIGHHHPSCLGTPIAKADVGRVFGILQHMSLTAYDNGKGVRLTHQELLLERKGSVEQTFWNISLSPLPGIDGYTDSVVGEFTDVTDSVVQDQHRSQGLEIFESISKVETLSELWSKSLMALDQNVPEVSFAMVYTALGHSSSVRSANLPTPDITPFCASSRSATSYFGKRYQLVHSLGVSEDVLGHVVDLDIAGSSDTTGLAAAFHEAHERKEIVTLSSEVLPYQPSLQHPSPHSVRSAYVLPISDINGVPLALIVLGLDSKRPLNEPTSHFVHYIHESIFKQAILVCLPKEQQDFQRKYEETTMALSHQLRLSILKSKKKEEKFLHIAKSAPLGMYLYSPKERTIQVNDAYLKITRTTKHDLHTDSAFRLPWLQTVSEEYMDVAIKEWQHLMTAKTPSAIEYKIRGPPDDPDPRWVSATSFPELDEHGEVYMIHGWIVDISDRLAKETLLAQRLEDALETKMATERFLDMVSHEMRNPLSAIVQCTDEIQEIIKTHKSRLDSPHITTSQLGALEEAAHTITLCAQHQNGIFNDILTVSKLDSQLVTIMPEKVRPVDIVQRALKMYGREAKRSGVATFVDIQDSYARYISEFVMVDPNRLLQIIINLLSNAINHTRSCKERSVIISLGASTSEPDDTFSQNGFMPPIPRKMSSPFSLTPEQDLFSTAFQSSCAGEEVYLQISVQDTGCGLSENEMSLLFRRFSQPKTYGQYNGSGLGLFLSKELIELQAGRIGVSSTEGVGTTFSFYVKCRRPIEDATLAPSLAPRSPRIKGHESRMSRTEAFDDKDLALIRNPSPVRNLHVLVVEDNPLNQRLVAKQLRNQGCTVHTADHGLDALTFLTQTTLNSNSPTGTKLDIVLLDIEMPVMDGLSCIRKIRSMEQEGFHTRRVPVIAVTANARDEQIKEALEAGMDDVVTKPFRIPELLVRMSDLVSAQHLT